jgi:Multicopper oxidase
LTAKSERKAEIVSLDFGKKAGLTPKSLAFVNKSDDMHPLHRHRHNFEITKIHGKETSGIFKDTVLIKGFSRVDVDFLKDNPGLTLFHCHQNLHMDFGFMRHAQGFLAGGSRGAGGLFNVHEYPFLLIVGGGVMSLDAWLTKKRNHLPKEI